VWDERRCDEPHWDQDLMMGGTSHRMQKMTTYALVDRIVSSFVDMGVFFVL